MLSTIQSTVKAQASATAARPPASAAAAKYAHAMAAQAAQFGGAAAAVTADAVTPLQPKTRARLFRKPTTLLSFFGRAAAGSQAPRAASGKAIEDPAGAPGKLGKGVKRKSADVAVAHGRDVKPAVKGGLSRPAPWPTGKLEVVDLSEDTPVKAAKVDNAAGLAGAPIANRTVGACPAAAAGSLPPDMEVAVPCKAEPAPEPPCLPAPPPDLPPWPRGGPTSPPDVEGPAAGQVCSAGEAAPAVTGRGSSNPAAAAVPGAEAGDRTAASCERDGPAAGVDSGGAMAAGSAMAASTVAAATGDGGGCVPGGAGSTGPSRHTKAGRIAARRAQSAEAEALSSVDAAPADADARGAVATPAPSAEPVEPAKVAAVTAAVQPLAEKQENGAGLPRGGAPRGGVGVKLNRGATPAAISTGGKAAAVTAGDSAAAAAARDTAPRAENAGPAASATEQMLALGFGPAEVSVALKVCRGNAARAIEYLLTR